MNKTRIEAFSDGVLAIIITIMVLELKVPHEPTLSALAAVWPVFLSYLLSFVYLGIYWNNHHHMFHAVRHVGGGVLWANLHLLFWLSLVPFVTAWMGENHFASVTLAAYGVVMLMSAIAYWLLQQSLIRHDGNSSLLAVAIGTDFKGKLSPLIYLLAILAAFVRPWISGALYVVVALIWFIPDRRIERVIEHEA
jgi:uncharacterized membrane protein